jgi:hypothetical protein
MKKGNFVYHSTWKVLGVVTESEKYLYKVKELDGYEINWYPQHTVEATDIEIVKALDNYLKINLIEKFKQQMGRDTV